MMAAEFNRGAGAPYSVRPVHFKGLQYTVRDREDRSVHLTRSAEGARRRAAKLNELARSEWAQAQRAAKLAQP